MSSNSQRFARIALDVFVAAGLGTDAEVKAAGGPSNSTLTLYRKAREGRVELPQPRSPIFNALDSIAGWEVGTARAVWKGAEPPPVQAHSPLVPGARHAGHSTDPRTALLAQRIAILEQRVNELEADARRTRQHGIRDT